MATARELGIDKNTLRRKMIRYGLAIPQSELECSEDEPDEV
jgi:DNA-binding NtrC family response regulator